MELSIPPLAVQFPAIDGDPGFSFHVPAVALETGKLTFLMGHNGSGKSVFLRILAGEIQPSRLGVNESKERAWICVGGVGFVRQQPELSLATDLTVKENLLLRLQVSRLRECIFPARFLGERTRALVDGHPELTRKLEQPCRNLSVGQRQTLAFLTVASQKAPLLLLDEFLAATDRATSGLLQMLARKYAEETPASVIVVSHDIGLALKEADRIIVFRQGGLAADLMRNCSEWNERNIVALLSYVEGD